jgi:hypothetical protein
MNKACILCKHEEECYYNHDFTIGNNRWFECADIGNRNVSTVPRKPFFQLLTREEMLAKLLYPPTNGVYYNDKIIKDYLNDHEKVSKR